MGATPLNLKQFQERMASDQAFSPFLLLESEDPFVVRSALKAVRKRLFQTESAEETMGRFEEEHLSLRTQSRESISKAITSLQTLPMFSSGKLVVLRDGEAMDGEAEKILLEYLSSVSNTTDSLLVLQCAKIRANAKLVKIASASGLHLKCALDRRPRFEGWIRTIAAEKGLKLNQELLQFLVDYVPRNLSRVEQELEKLSLYSDQRGSVDLGTASQLVCATNLQNVFALTDAIGSRDVKEAVVLLKAMLDQGDSPQMLLAMIAWHMRNLYRVKMVATERIGRQALLKGLGTNSSFVLDKASRQARGFTLDGLRRAMSLFFDTDRTLKSTSLPGDLVLERLVTKLCRLPKPTRMKVYE